METQKLLGIILISFGIFLILINFNLIPGSAILFIFALGFLYAYYKWGRNLGFLIPGLIFLAIGTFTILEKTWNIGGIYFLLFLGLAFIFVFLLHTSKLPSKDYGERYWPLYPGFILTGLSLILIFQQRLAMYLNIVIPILFILIGVLMLIKGFKKT
ncbi:MAG: hypothetical protein NZ841_03450 [Dictyoglomus sp.]|nr:hypothetical protein [Dictyoglomus sp.]MCX7942248.1 hypothetical protein [Dictyoglomaceae bacterium]MDW8188335.1 hypothetical protein [Dictyoglomus sp.]